MQKQNNDNLIKAYKELQADKTRLEGQVSELRDALENANTRLWGVLVKMNDFLSHGLDVDLPTGTDRDMTAKVYDETKTILKKY
jgi:hypothetical protein